MFVNQRYVVLSIASIYNMLFSSLCLLDSAFVLLIFSIYAAHVPYSLIQSFRRTRYRIYDTFIHGAEPIECNSVRKWRSGEHSTDGCWRRLLCRRSRAVEIGSCI